MTSPFPIYRIIHHSNLPHILDIGKVTCPNHAQSNPVYQNIGNNDIIRKRSAKAVPLHADRTYLDYIAFYFGPRSIMLLNIKTGYEVDMVPQGEIIYLVYDISKIREHGYEFFFTDGQANKIPVTRVYNDLNDLNKIDMEAAYARNFSASEQLKYPDLKRKKHAEFQIYNEMDFEHIEEIIVLNQERKIAVEGMIEQYSRQKAVRIDTNVYF